MPVSTSPEGSGHHNVLIADDEPDILELVALFLSDEGYAVVTATDGQQALEAAQATHFALAVLDVTMPRVDGLQVAARLRVDQPAAKIIFHSAMPEHWVRQRFSDFHAFVQKPATIDRLVGKAKELLAN